MFELQNRNCLEKHIDSFHVNQITKIFLVSFFSTEAWHCEGCSDDIWSWKLIKKLRQSQHVDWKIENLQRQLCLFLIFWNMNRDCRTQNTEHGTQNTEQRTQYTVHSTQNTEHRTHNTEHRTQNTEHRTQNTEHCPAAIILTSTSLH